MYEPDFSGIDPLRVPEARRRIAAINQYLGLANPTTADATRISATIGLSRWQFQRLARAWREHRNPSLLVVGRRGTASRDYGLAARAVEIAKDEITKAGPGAELATLAPEVERRCRAEGITPPSRPTIWNYMRKARASGAVRADGPPRIVIGRMWFHLPVTDLAEGQAGTNMPALLAAVALPEGIVLAHRISFDDRDPPSVASLVKELLAHRSIGAEPRALLLEANDRRAAADVLAACGMRHLRAHNRSVQRELSRAFGGKIGRLPALYRRGLARPESKVVVQRQDERITVQAAEAAINEAIEASNAAVAVPVPAFDIADIA